ncbi:dipeptidyl carboxypeptidase II, partial [Xanthomonas hortorum pv. gardneri]
MSRTVVLAAAITLALAACSGKDSSGKESTTVPEKTAATPAADAAPNPLLTPSTLPFQAPPFDKIKDSDYLPAFEEGMRLQLAAIRKIADNPEPPTFDYTIEAMDRGGETP